MKIKYYRLESVVLLALVFSFLFPRYSLAVDPIEFDQSVMLPDLVIKAVVEDNQKISLITPTRVYKVLDTYQIPITAYSSTVDQTDDTPCITANGFDLCAHDQENVIAANFLPFGTKVRIPEYYGDRIFTVQDRMNARYYYRADIWMKTRQAAIELGLVYTKLEVIE